MKKTFKRVCTDGVRSLIGSFFIMIVSGNVFLQTSLKNYLKSFYINTYHNESDASNFYYFFLFEIFYKVGGLIGAILFNFVHVHVKT